MDRLQREKANGYDCHTHMYGKERANEKKSMAWNGNGGHWSDIKKIRDVERFFRIIYYIDEVSFHPDDDFCDYVNTTTGMPTYSKHQAKQFNKMMADSFEVCEREGIDIYDLGMRIMGLKS